MNNHSCVQLIDMFVSFNELHMPISAVQLKKVVFKTHSQGEIDFEFSTVSFRKVGKNYQFSISSKFHSDTYFSNPDDFISLVDLEFEGPNGEPTLISEVPRVLVIGEDADGYALAKEICVPKNADYLHKDVTIRHLVVTGIHGNFKNEQQAKIRAALYEGAKIIKVPG